MKKYTFIIFIAIVLISVVGAILWFRRDIADHIAWCQTRGANRLYYYERYRRNFPNGHHIASVQFKLRDAATWHAVKATESLTDVSAYFEVYPNGLFKDEAQARVAELQYLNRLKECSTAQAIADLMQKEKVPNTYFRRSRDRMKELVLSELKELETERQLDEYLAQSPIAREYEYDLNQRRKTVKHHDRKTEEERLAWEKAVEGDDGWSYNAYLREYPAGKYAQEARQKKHDRYWEAVISTDHPTLRTFDENDNLIPARKTTDLYYEDYKRYLEEFPDGEHVQEAREYVDSYVWDFASLGDNIRRYQWYLEECPYGRKVQQARQRIETLRQDRSIHIAYGVDGLLRFLENYPGHIRESEIVNKLVPGLLDGRYRTKVAKVLKEKGWEPRTDKERIYFAVAANDKTFLQQHHNEAIAIFLNSVENPEFDLERYGALYALIDIGEESSIPQLKNILRAKESVGLAEAYLNCGHKGLEEFARSWARSKGYAISQSQFGYAPAQWGSLK